MGGGQGVPPLPVHGHPAGGDAYGLPDDRQGPLGRAGFRSWTFDSDGGFGEATWSRDGGRWLVHATGALAEGGTMSATNIFSRVDADTFTWQTTERVVDGEELPDLPPSR